MGLPSTCRAPSRTPEKQRNAFDPLSRAKSFAVPVVARPKLRVRRGYSRVLHRELHEGPIERSGYDEAVRQQEPVVSQLLPVGAGSSGGAESTRKEWVTFCCQSTRRKTKSRKNPQQRQR